MAAFSRKNNFIKLNNLIVLKNCIIVAELLFWLSIGSANTLKIILPFRRHVRRIHILLGILRHHRLDSHHCHPHRIADIYVTVVLRIRLHLVYQRSHRRVDHKLGLVFPYSCRRQSRHRDRHPRNRRHLHTLHQIHHRFLVGCIDIPRHPCHLLVEDPPGHHCRCTTAPRPAWLTAIREILRLCYKIGE